MMGREFSQRNYLLLVPYLSAVTTLCIKLKSKTIHPLYFSEEQLRKNIYNKIISALKPFVCNYYFSQERF